MKLSAVSFSLLAAFSLAAAARAASIDMNDPHRALGREDDVRVDAQLSQDTVTAGAPIGVTYQIQNFSREPVAIADRVSDASYDEDSRTITVAFGSEVPPDGNLPHMVLVEPGQKVVLKGSATPVINSAIYRSSLGAPPRFVRIKVAILRNIRPFASLIGKQAGSPQRLPDELFDTWFECNDTIFLNELPVRWKQGRSQETVRSAEYGTD